MKVQEIVENHFHIFKFKGDFTMYSAYEFKALFTQKSRSDLKRFAFDLSEVGMIDSAGVGALIMVHKTVAGIDGGEMFIFGCNAQVMRTFQTLGANIILRIVDRYEDGLAPVVAPPGDPSRLEG